MSLVALHDAEKSTKYPNLALMKLSAWHKAQGDKVEWFMPFKAHDYDIVYSSKVFTWTPDDPYLPDTAIKGGTGYGVTTALPDEIEHICPDYALYGCDKSYGFLTRGCIRSCPWCIVPKKEGRIRAHADIEEFCRHKTVILMDNNVLAHPHGVAQIEKMARMGLRVDFNQGLDARLIDAPMARRLAALKWDKYLRLACDSKGQMPSVERAVKNLRAAGFRSGIFAYVLVQDVEDALERVEFLRRLKVDPFAQPYRDFENKVEPTREQKNFARWVNMKATFKSVAWKDYGKRFAKHDGDRGMLI